MRSIFSVGFRADPWTTRSRRLGQWGAIISALPSLVTAGVSIYETRKAREAAEDAKKAQEARAAAEQARADAEKKKAEEDLKVAQEQAAAAKAATAPTEGPILGLPKEYVLYGGLGLGAILVLGLVVGLTKSNK